MLGRRSRLLCVAVLLAAMPLGIRLAAAATPEPYDPWPGLVQDIFSNRAINDGAGVIAIEMPYRAEDAAIVPVTLRATLPPGDARRVLAITLVIDQNPAPMAARFELGQDSSVSEISTRVRVNNYTDVHAVAELSDGKLYMTKTHVKASGGCSAPAAKNVEEAIWCLRWKAAFRSRKTPIFDSPMFRTARSVSASRPRTPRATCSRMNGRSTAPGFDAARCHWMGGLRSRMTARIRNIALPLRPGRAADR